MRFVLYSLRKVSADDAVAHLRHSRAFDHPVAVSDHLTLATALAVRDIDVLMVDHRTVPDFLRFEAERGPVRPPRVVGTRVDPELIRDDVRRAGFDATVGLGGNATLLSFTDEISDVVEMCRHETYQRPARELDDNEILLAFSVVYLDRIDYSIGSRVAQGMTDAEIASALGFALQTVRNRLHRILDRSRLRNRTELAVHHSRAVTVQSDGSLSGRVDVR